ncbi:ribosomal RNA small subunit methyltransferase, mitochondrial isoform X1 [Dendrobium catenatum]|uniref:rRNA adenine N(6)-methyltransferase n=1 Tax=Dendrobium catenatum TaxID=906689 RepID=A0A2I0W8D2_9ASPA|nr:ribosomal RNA small subunit methyltransferase, mitochondrial isoform X1 [Dendrobium catenatum]PKU71927.1 18S rRNA (adenine1779-N6/adenine1780-N6)-dimethyltransferase [Dendrobium catenatum]
MIFWSAVLRHLTLWRAPIVSGAIERGVKVHCSALLKHSLSSVSFRETLECKYPLSSFNLVNFSSSPSKPTSDVHFLTSTNDENKCGETDQVEEMPEAFPLEIQVKRITNTAGLMRNYILKSIDVSVSRPSLVTGEEHENNMRIGDDEEERDNSRLCQSGIPLTLNDSKQQRDSMEFCCASRKDDLAGAGSFIRKNKKYGMKIYSYEGRGFWQEEGVEYRHKLKQKERWQGESFHLLKSRGQHLLTNPRVLDSIIRRAKVLPTDTVLEIGPGTGNLTVRLLELALKVIAVEIDERMVNTLQNRVAKLGLEDKLVVITGNVLKMELPHFDLCVSNIPYGISSPLIAKIFLRSFKSCFRSAILLLQKEFACRLLAKPGESDFNRLALNVRLVASVDFLMNVSKKDFVPCPKVDSSLVQIQPKLKIPDINLDEWLGFTRTCFSKRNKTLSAIFKQKKKIIDLYENSQSNIKNCKTTENEDRVGDYDLDGTNESDEGSATSLELGLQNSTEVLRFKEKIVRVLKDGGFGEKRPSKLSNEEFLCLLQLFNKEGVFFH